MPHTLPHARVGVSYRDQINPAPFLPVTESHSPLDLPGDKNVTPP